MSSASYNKDASVMTLHCTTPHSNVVWMSRYAFRIKGYDLKDRESHVKHSIVLQCDLP